jgi:hypothetical protein
MFTVSVAQRDGHDQTLYPRKQIGFPVSCRFLSVWCFPLVSRGRQGPAPPDPPLYRYWRLVSNRDGVPEDYVMRESTIGQPLMVLLVALPKVVAVWV